MTHLAVAVFVNATTRNERPRLPLSPSRSLQQSTSGSCACDQSNRCRGTILGSLSSSFPAAVVPVNNRLTGQTTPRETVCPLPYPASAIIIVKSCLPGHVRPKSSPRPPPLRVSLPNFARWDAIPSALSLPRSERYVFADDKQCSPMEDFNFVDTSLIHRSTGLSANAQRGSAPKKGNLRYRPSFMYNSSDTNTR